MVGKTGKEVFLRRTLTRGSQNGIGVFSRTEAGEQQIAWVPEKDQATMGAVGKACHLPNFPAKIDSTITTHFQTLTKLRTLPSILLCGLFRNPRFHLNKI